MFLRTLKSPNAIDRPLERKTEMLVFFIWIFSGVVGPKLPCDWHVPIRGVFGDDVIELEITTL